MSVLLRKENNKYLIIQKSEEGNYVIVIDSGSYNKRMELMLSDQTKFIKADVLDNNLLLKFPSVK